MRRPLFLLQLSVTWITMALTIIFGFFYIGCASAPGPPLPKLAPPVDVATLVPRGQDLDIDDCMILAAEVAAHLQLRTAERVAALELEKACQQRVIRLEAEVVAADQWSKMRAMVLFLAGVVIGGITAVAIQPIAQ